MGRRVIVTGASSGIGAALAARLTAMGDEVAICARRADRLAEVPAAHRFVVDVGDLGSLAAFAAAAEAAMGGVDLLVNNAGLAQGLSPAQNADLNDWHTMIDTNITAMVVLTRKLLPTLIGRKGAIIAIGSVAGSYIYPGGNVYAGSKAFVNHFTLALRAAPVDLCRMHRSSCRDSANDPLDGTNIGTGTEDRFRPLLWRPDDAPGPEPTSGRARTTGSLSPIQSPPKLQEYRSAGKVPLAPGCLSA